jgi:protein arginine kinase activator
MKKCGRCSKPAVLHITELRHGEVQALHLCESCAKDYLSQAPAPASEEIPAGIEPESGEELDELDQRVCPSCGITFKEFRAHGRLGCPHDYIAFEDELLPLLENIHGETEHRGKIPKRAPDSSQQQFRLIKLRSELRTAVDEERYEDAARIRDEIRHVETGTLGDEPPSV